MTQQEIEIIMNTSFSEEQIKSWKLEPVAKLIYASHLRSQLELLQNVLEYPNDVSKYPETIEIKIAEIESQLNTLTYKDPRDHPLTGDDDWIHDVDMGGKIV